MTRNSDQNAASCTRGKHTLSRFLWRKSRAPVTEQVPKGIGPPNGFAMLPWLLMSMGSAANLLRGETPVPVMGATGLLAFNSMYITVVFRAFDKVKRTAPSTRWILCAMAVISCSLAIGYGGSWLLFYPLFALAVGSVLRGRALAWVMLGLTAVAGATAGYGRGWDGVGLAYGTFISGMVTAAILALSETVKELQATREELARTAVARERLRFSRDLHDLLGHTLSVIVVKSEAARRMATRDLDAALVQITDIESVGRQALTEIREAVTGYREGSLSGELDRARSALTAAGIEPDIRRSGPPLTAQHEALLGWVVREAVTNAVRHSAAEHCEISVSGNAERVKLHVKDDGRGTTACDEETASQPGTLHTTGGTGLKGLTERLASAGGSLVAGPSPRGGFLVTAELPVESALAVTDLEPAGTGP